MNNFELDYNVLRKISRALGKITECPVLGCQNKKNKESMLCDSCLKKYGTDGAYYANCKLNAILNFIDPITFQRLTDVVIGRMEEFEINNNNVEASAKILLEKIENESLTPKKISLTGARNIIISAKKELNLPVIFQKK